MKKILLILIAIILLTACTRTVETPEPPPTVEVPNINPLNGEAGAPQEAVLMWVVDNHPDARPQDGLEWADIVYEVPVEGGLTRLLMITAKKANAVVGPIRSARGYFALLAAEYGAALVHHGASTSYSGAAMALGIRDVDLTSPGSQPVWRDAGRFAPHNLYSNVGQVYEYRSFPSEYSGRTWPYSEDIKLGNYKNITLTYPGGYTVNYEYSQGGYSRAEELVFQNILVQQTTVRDGDEVNVELLSSGTAYLFTQGQVLSGTWTKLTAASPTKFTDAQGKEWELSPGKTIVHIVPVLTSIRFK